MRPVIFLDLDDTLCEWSAPVCRLFGVDPAVKFANWPKGNLYNIEPILGITNETLWQKINSKGSEFWANLPETDWARELYKEARKLGDTIILTAPADSPYCVAGKLEWIHKFTDDPRFGNYVITRRKELCAGPGRILIDDGQHNIDKFREANGKAIVVPRPWNSMRSEWEYGLTKAHILTKLRDSAKIV